MTVNKSSGFVSRDVLAKTYCKGEGLEIGAGCLPTAVSEKVIVHYADKRTPEELKTYFASSAAINVESLSTFEGKKFDFLMAHHVLEHSANVIQTLIHWMSLVKDDGVLFLCLPNRHITPDASRLLTPPTHFLLDYVNRTTEDDYESREHICSFLWGWIDTGGLQDKTKLEAAALVSNALNSAVNDLHWHTFNIDTMKFAINMAASLSGRTVAIEFEQDGFQVHNEHKLVCRLVKRISPISENINQLINLRERLRSVIYDVALEEMEGCATFSLSKEHKGKIFQIDHGKVRWIRSPKTLKDKGLDTCDFTYLEISDEEKTLLGPEIGEALECRRKPIVMRLMGLEKVPGIELSPGAVPIIEKKTFNVTYLDKFDHTTSDDTYFETPAVSIDYLLGNNLIDEVLENNTYNYLISSHVIEHVPDFIQFFKSSANVLKNGARLIMYVPDKRYTFDVLRSVSTISDIEEAHIQHLRYPSRAMAREWYSKTDLNVRNAAELWDGTYTAAPTYGSNEAAQKTNEVDLSTADFHCFTFTPESFRTLINYIIEKHVPTLEVLEITETPRGHNEFIVDLILNKDLLPQSI